MRSWGKHELEVSLLAAIACSCALATTAIGKTFDANRTGDPQPGKCTKKHCTLREAVGAANDREGRDVIRLAPGKRYELAIPPEPGDGSGNAGGDLDTRDPVRIETRAKKRGAGNRATIDANEVDGAIDADGAPLTLRRLTVTGGRSIECAAVKASFARLTIARSRVSENVADVNGGGVCAFQGPTKIVKSEIVGNEADNLGGGAQIYGPLIVVGSTFRGNEGGGGGGLAYVGEDRITVRDSVFTGNMANSGGAIRASSIAINECPVFRLEHSTLVGNNAASGGGGVLTGCLSNRIEASTITGNEAGTGGGILVGSPTRVVNSTIAGNDAVDQGGGISSSGSALAVRNTTVSGNSAGISGGGVAAPGAETQIRNALIALNTGGAGPDCSGAFFSQGGNLLGDDTGCVGFDAPTDRVRPNPKLGELKRNGGPTKTMALRRGSPAINAGVKPAPKRDQRGVKRAGKPDVGAYERARKRR